jgi:hypothetical protein
MRRRAAAFTMIELLLVVAIIRADGGLISADQY